jgi:hypothetical protein
MGEVVNPWKEIVDFSSILFHVTVAVLIYSSHLF